MFVKMGLVIKFKLTMFHFIHARLIYKMKQKRKSDSKVEYITKIKVKFWTRKEIIEISVFLFFILFLICFLPDVLIENFKNFKIVVTLKNNETFYFFSYQQIWTNCLSEINNQTLHSNGSLFFSSVSQRCRSNLSDQHYLT